MRIGASFNLPPLLQRPATPAVTPAPSNTDSDTSGSSKSAAPVTEIEISRDQLSARTTQQADSSRFYSTHRDIPLRGQEAMHTYLTNAGFQFGSARSELVGVDVYA
jgi:hypothetical protein